MKQNNISLLSAVLGGKWLIETRYALGFLTQVELLLKGQSLDLGNDKETKPVSYAISAGGGRVRRFESFDMAEPGSVAVIPIQGVIMKDSYWTAGTQEMSFWAKEADNHPNISATVLQLASGGGAVDGTFEFADVLSSLQKPVVSWVDGMCASAAYAIGVRAQHIMMSHATAEIGSIGTAIRFADYTKLFEEWGIKLHNIRATDSYLKNEDYFQALEGNYEPIIQNILNPTNDIFLNSVRQYRSGKLKEGKPLEGKTAGAPLNGQMYLSQAAIDDYGLADSIGTFDEAIALAQELGRTPKTQIVNPFNQNTNQNRTMPKLTSTLVAIAGFLGWTPSASQSETQLTQEHVDKINGEMSRLQAENQTLTADKTNLQTQLDQAQADLKVANTSLVAAEQSAKDWKAKADEYGSQPGATPTTPVKSGETLESGNESDTTKVIANLPHNRQLDNNPMFN
ncbi:S49 family peptidase [Xanthocytophaga flava]|uniref:S49 family peptidase n=1 Tax=Xanthocytophaga flava TaxID=3048013 RepID=UPI0028D8D1FD|nr:S49 family peptidase [Xanthocytophaga flavus]MDJ1472848.1 S49 family peptidase [Xanthocytophaga flavus]